ncbi:hypothetical protein [Nocardia camponoti]|uniref:Type IV secretory pathway, VirB4 components n=1 Tax=Nocardia camponoti TaxID=1616106 RepID=A0A917QAJ4_9NOCA|nr:hypothetical protein [Nocardia camponoti]GGK39772.1 hypothetical protein GCM10011591_09300 [Nocardia camponoti]
MGRDYEDIALRPVHRPPRIRGEAEPRPAGGASRVSDDVLDLSERTETASARGTRSLSDAELAEQDRRAREEAARARAERRRALEEEELRNAADTHRGAVDDEWRPSADRRRDVDRGRAEVGEPGSGRVRRGRDNPAEPADRERSRNSGGRGLRGARAGGGRSDGRESTRGQIAGDVDARGKRIPRRTLPSLRPEDHGPRLQHERANPEARAKNAEPRAKKPPKQTRARKPQRVGKPDRDTLHDDVADRLMGVGPTKAKKPEKRSGPSLLDDAARARYEMIAREQSGLRAAWATFRIHTDDLRRNNAQARNEAIDKDGFERTTAELTDRGYSGAGGGKMNVVGRPVEYRATTAQVAGLWPWSVGAGAPLIGTPLGSHLHTGAPVCFDPMNWFMRGSFITAPSLFVLGLNGFGKSSLVRRIVLGGVAQGVTPLILADVKPDYRKLVELVGGQVIDLGYGHGKLNPLAAGVLGSVVPMLEDKPILQRQVLQDLRARQVTLIAGLVELVRGARVADFEETLIATALRVLYAPGSEYAPDKPPIMENLLEVIVAGGAELMLDAGADDEDEYAHAIKNLRRSLRALTQGPFGAIFNGQTSVPIDTGAVAVCIDVSHIPTGDKKLKAAVMLACWADGFASVEAAHVLADADLGPQRYFQVVMDELWQVLGLGDFMVDRVDELTRLQRGLATALIMISHTIKDLQALGSEAAIAKALGFLERARAKIFGALPAEELTRLDSTVPFTTAETEMVTGWSAPQALTGEALKPGQQRPSPPGTGKFLLKIGEDRRPGIPFHMEFTMSEKASGIHDTNQRFSEFGDTRTDEERP